MVLVRCLRSETGSEGAMGSWWVKVGRGLIGVGISWHLHLYFEYILSLLLSRAAGVGIGRGSSERGETGRDLEVMVRA